MLFLLYVAVTVILYSVVVLILFVFSLLLNMYYLRATNHQNQIPCVSILYLANKADSDSEKELNL